MGMWEVGGGEWRLEGLSERVRYCKQPATTNQMDQDRHCQHLKAGTRTLAAVVHGAGASGPSRGQPVVQASVLLRQEAVQDLQRARGRRGVHYGSQGFVPGLGGLKEKKRRVGEGAIEEQGQDVERLAERQKNKEGYTGVERAPPPLLLTFTLPSSSSPFRSHLCALIGRHRQQPPHQRLQALPQQLWVPLRQDLNQLGSPLTEGGVGGGAGLSGVPDLQGRARKG